MTVKAKKMRLLALLATLCLLLAGCGELPPAALQQSTPEGQTPLSAEPEAGPRASRPPRCISAMAIPPCCGRKRAN